jgi:chemotaxis protein histidine kinase CheA
LIETEQGHADEGFFDDDIIDIFVEEAAEVLEEIDEFYPQWLADSENIAALEEIRRGFHTLKGSGRMVRAVVIGDLAWSIEVLLNRVLDGTVPSTGAVYSLVQKAAEQIPALVDSFKRHLPTVRTKQIETIIVQAEAICRGELIQVDEDEVLIDRYETDAELTDVPMATTLMVADEAGLGVPLSKSNILGSTSRVEDFVDKSQFDALQERCASTEGSVTRLLSAYEKLTLQSDALDQRVSQADSDASVYVSRQEVHGFSDQLKALEKEIQELRYFIKGSSQKMLEDLRKEQDSHVQRVFLRVEELESEIDEGRKNTLKLSTRINLAIALAAIFSLCGGGLGAAMMYFLHHS